MTELFTLPTNAIGDTISYIGKIFATFSPFIYLCIGIPLGFFIFEKMIDIILRIREEKELEKERKKAMYLFREQEIKRFRGIAEPTKKITDIYKGKVKSEVRVKELPRIKGEIKVK